MGGMVQDGGLGYAFVSNRRGRWSVSILSVVVGNMKKPFENLPHATNRTYFATYVNFNVLSVT